MGFTPSSTAALEHEPTQPVGANPETKEYPVTSVVLVGTFDTKARELAWLKQRIEAAGCSVHLIDVGVLGTPALLADTTRDEVASAGGATLGDLQGSGDRGASLKVMSLGAAAVVTRLREAGALDGLLAIGGSGGSSIAAAAMQALPVGVPKLLVSTMASGDVSPLVGGADVTLMYSVVDVAGINRISRTIFRNAAAAIVGMAEAESQTGAADDAAGRDAAQAETDDDRPLIAASMFGVTTAAVENAAARLDELGYETVVFHATGAGGKALEALAAGGYLAGVLDLTTTELADELVGGVLTAGPDRLTAAGRSGVPQVVSLGALDMVNFGPRQTLPERFGSRVIYEHNSTVTLMRTTVDESARIGAVLAGKVAEATSPTVVLVPLRGVSALDAEGGLFADRLADDALFGAVRRGLADTDVPLIELDLHINDEAFALEAADRLHALITRQDAPDETPHETPSATHRTEHEEFAR